MSQEVSLVARREGLVKSEMRPPLLGGDPWNPQYVGAPSQSDKV
jgi:hypothetical protein